MNKNNFIAVLQFENSRSCVWSKLVTFLCGNSGYKYWRITNYILNERQFKIELNDIYY